MQNYSRKTIQFFYLQTPLCDIFETDFKLVYDNTTLKKGDMLNYWLTFSPPVKRLRVRAHDSSSGLECTTTHRAAERVWRPKMH